MLFVTERLEVCFAMRRRANNCHGQITLDSRGLDVVKVEMRFGPWGTVNCCNAGWTQYQCLRLDQYTLRYQIITVG